MKVRQLIKAALIPCLSCLLVLIGLAYYEYRDGCRDIKTKFDDIAAKLATRLAGSLSEPLWNFDEAAIENTIKSELRTTIYDCTICVIEEKSNRFYGFTKSTDGKIEKVRQTPNETEFSAGDVTVRNGLPVASIRVYMNKQLHLAAENDLLYDITMRMSLIGTGLITIICVVVYFFILLLDRLAERKQALQVSELRYQSLVENAPLPILVHYEGIIRYLNPAARAMFGVTPEANMIGHSIKEFVASDSVAAYEEKLKQAKDLACSPKVSPYGMRVFLAHGAWEIFNERQEAYTAADHREVASGRG